MVSDKAVYLFDSFTKQNILIVPIDDTNIFKIIFHREDLVAVGSDAIYCLNDDAITGCKFKVSDCLLRGALASLNWKSKPSTISTI